MFDLLGDVAALIAGRGLHLGALTAVLAERYDDRLAFAEPVTLPGRAVKVRTFLDVEDAVADLAGAHRDTGVKEGDRVLVVLGNRLDVVLHVLALTRLGAVPVPVNARYTAAEMGAIVTASGATRAIADDGVATQVAGVLSDDAVVRIGDTDGAGFAAALATTDPLAPLRGRDPRHVALLLTTSGTTGTPKAAALTSYGLLASLGRLAAVPVGRANGPRADRDLVFAALPLTHIMGLSTALASLCAGVPLLHHERFDPKQTLIEIERERPNVFIGVPTMYADLEAAGAGSRDLSSVQLWVSAADAMPADRARRFQRFGAALQVRNRKIGAAAFADIYGMVELSGGAAIRLYPPSLVARVTVPSVASVLPGIEVRAVDEDGERTILGQVGELEFRGAGVLNGYVGHDDEGVRSDGWFPSGDHGRVWPGGLFSFAGRARDRLKVGGFSVFPAEVEEALSEHPDVAEVAVVGLPDERLGDRPVAIVVPRAGATVDPDTFTAWARDEVVGYRRPTDTRLVPDIPRGPNGKIDRAAATAIALDLWEVTT